MLSKKRQRPPSPASDADGDFGDGSLSALATLSAVASRTAVAGAALWPAAAGSAARDDSAVGLPLAAAALLPAALAASEDLAPVTQDGKEFQCHYCAYRAKLASTVERHELTHTGERPYQCSHCDYAAAQKSTVLRHERRHTGERPFLCKFCGYRAARRMQIEEHERVHTGERPYQCRFCPFRYGCAHLAELHCRGAAVVAMVVNSNVLAMRACGPAAACGA
jgi:hypothetical protein